MTSRINNRGRGNRGYDNLVPRSSRGRPMAPFPDVPLPGDTDIMDGLLPTPIQILSKPADAPGSNIKLENVQYVGSYNWTDSEQPTIIVPGAPPEWRDRTLPFSIPRDSGMITINRDLHQFPATPLLLLFRAADIVAADDVDTSVEWSTVDFVTDRNNIRKLLRWINGGEKEFRIDTQLAGKRTILMNIWSPRTMEDSGLQWSYGRRFEREATVPAKGCEKSTEHIRILQFEFDGLKMVTRFEVDAYVADAADVDGLANQLSGLDVSSSRQNCEPTKPAGSTGSGPEVAIIRGGTQVPQGTLVEMTTRSINWVDNFDWFEAYPQLYFSQTPHHFLAVHNRGTFNSITKRQLGSPEMERVESDMQPAFRKLRRVFLTIQDLVMEHGQRGRLSLVFREGVLQVFERSSQDSCLPEDVMERFGF